MGNLGDLDPVERFWIVARQLAVQAPKPADGLYAGLRRDLERIHAGSPEEYTQAVTRLAKLCGV